MYAYLRFRQVTTVFVMAAAMSTAACSPGAGASEWNVTNNVDAMTDVGLMKAEGMLEGENFDLETVVACTSTGKVVYQFRAFDKAGEPANINNDAIHGSRGKIVHVRMDDKQPNEWWDFSRFSNGIVITPSFSTGMAAAKRVILRLRMVNGDETYTLDQSDQKLQSVLQSCPDKLAKGKTEAAGDSGMGKIEAGTAEASPEAAAAEPEYKVVTNEFGETTHVYPVKGRRSDGTFVIMQVGFTPGERPTGEIATAHGTEDAPIRFDMLQEIEAATGRPYQEGDTIYGRAQPA